MHAPIQTTELLKAKYIKKAKMAGLAKSRFLFDRTMPVRQVQDNPVYAGMMETTDRAVGMVMKKLDELGLADNTVVIFTGDNGGVSSGDAYATSNLPLRGGKGRQWEGGVREPYYIKVPGMTAKGSVSDIPVTGTDFYPTILELAGRAPKPQQHVDGLRLVPVLKGGKLAKRDLFWHYPHYGNQGGEPVAIIRSGNWKLIHYYEDGRDELYDITADIGEQTDRIKAYPKIASTMRTKIDAWLKDTGALIPKKDDRFDPAKKKVQIENQKTKRLKSLETRHAAYFK